MLFHWKGGYEVINQDLRTTNDCGQVWGATLRSAMRCCDTSAEACWDTCMWLCAAYLKPRHAAGLKSDVDPAVFRTVIYSVRFEFHFNTNTHVLFLAFRWGGSMSACITAQPVPVAVWQLECTLLWHCMTYKERRGTTTTSCVYIRLRSNGHCCWKTSMLCFTQICVFLLFTWWRNRHENPEKLFNERW